MVEVKRSVEGERQAEPDWATLIAPLRQAGQALGAAGELVRQLDDEATLWTWLQALNELPASITFRPFATTAEWSVVMRTQSWAFSVSAVSGIDDSLK